MQVACTWEAIAKALQDITPSQAAGGFEIQVAAGTLPQSDQRDTLSELGHLDWKRNVLVVPRDGWGSITMSGEARLRRLHRVTFARFNGDFVALTDCSGSNWAQSKLAHGLRIYAQELDVRECNVYEAVVEGEKSATRIHSSTRPMARVRSASVCGRAATAHRCTGAWGHAPTSTPSRCSAGHRIEDLPSATPCSSAATTPPFNSVGPCRATPAWAPHSSPWRTPC